MSARKPTAQSPGVALLRGATTYARGLGGSGGFDIGGHRRIKEDAAVYAAIYSSPPCELQVPGLDVPRLYVDLTPSRVRGGVQGQTPRPYDARNHSLFLAPAAVPVVWSKGAPSRHLVIYFQPHLFDPADSLARLLLIRLFRRLGSTDKPIHALSPNVLARLRDEVLANSSERIPVSDLAEQTGLSANRFAHGFTEQTGGPPHQFVLALRLESRWNPQLAGFGVLGTSTCSRRPASSTG